ncbi:phage tail protein [Vibrio fluvialis]|nr:phage tail protein [Vibrio fluvialis]
MYFAKNDSLYESEKEVEGAISITEEQYNDALSAKTSGRKAYVKDGALIVYSGKPKSIFNTLDLSECQIDENEIVPDGWTDHAPATSFDYWLNGKWLTDQQKRYEFELQKVSDTRYQLYVQIVDRLNREAEMILQIEGDQAKADEYKKQAEAAYIKIRTENPYPAPPEI